MSELTQGELTPEKSLKFALEDYLNNVKGGPTAYMVVAGYAKELVVDPTIADEAKRIIAKAVGSDAASAVVDSLVEAVPVLEKVPVADSSRPGRIIDVVDPQEIFFRILRDPGRDPAFSKLVTMLMSASGHDPQLYIDAVSRWDESVGYDGDQGEDEGRSAPPKVLGGKRPRIRFG